MKSKQPPDLAWQIGTLAVMAATQHNKGKNIIDVDAAISTVREYLMKPHVIKQLATTPSPLSTAEAEKGVKTAECFIWVDGTKVFPEKHKVVACKVTYEDIDPRQDWELHWSYVDNNNRWQHLKNFKRIEWLSPAQQFQREGMEGGYGNP